MPIPDYFRCLLLLALLLLCLVPEWVLAGKFETISGGFASDPATKIRMLKTVAVYAGLFFMVSGVGLFFGRGKLDLKITAPIAIFAIGLALVSVRFF